MSASPKLLLPLALTGMVGGVLVASSQRNLPLALDVLMPLGAIFTGLFLVSLLLKKEVVKFNDDERLRNEVVKRYRSSFIGAPEKRKEEASDVPVTSKVAEPERKIRHGQAVEEAVEVWRNEGDPN